MKITRGETPTFKVYLPSSVDPEDLGTAYVAVAQNLVLIEPTVVGPLSDVNGNYVTFTLTEAQSLSLVSGQNAFFQFTWKNVDNADDQDPNNDVTTIVKGAMHRFWVSDSLIEEVGS